MARRLNVQRLMVVMGVLVLGLGGLVLYATSQGARWGLDPQPDGERVRLQVREQMGRGSEVRYVVSGRGPALCGYAAMRGQSEAVAFVSRPNRILFANDPLPGEFKTMQTRDCPGFLAPPPSILASPASTRD